MILRPGEKIVCDTGVMSLMDDTVLTGPGKVCLQTMTVANLAKLRIPFLPLKK